MANVDCLSICSSYVCSVSEYLMGDMVTQQQLNTDTKVMSCDDIAKATHQEEPAVDKQEQKKSQFVIATL